jgi:hypothetical protein
MRLQTSIHPTGRHDMLHKHKDGKTNICATRNPDRKGKLAKASKELDRRRRYHSLMKDSTGHRLPGSMQL